MCQIRLFHSKVSLARKNMLSIVTCRQKTIASLDVFQKGQGPLNQAVRRRLPPECLRRQQMTAVAAPSTVQNCKDRFFT